VTMRPAEERPFDEPARWIAAAAILRADLSERVVRLRALRAAQGAHGGAATLTASAEIVGQLERAIPVLVTLAAIEPESAVEPWTDLCQLAGYRIRLTRNWESRLQAALQFPGKEARVT
jgi:hypothetical protein